MQELVSKLREKMLCKRPKNMYSLNSKYNIHIELIEKILVYHSKKEHLFTIQQIKTIFQKYKI